MANREIRADVKGETIKLSNRVAGASGSFNAVSLAFTFDGAWDDTTKKVYFFDINGENAVYRLLTLDLLDEDGAYIVPIPAEPLRYAGEMTITVRGIDLADDGETAERIIISASTTMKVLNAVTPDDDVAPVEPTPTQAEQLQAEIDGIKDSIAGAAQAAIDAEASADAAAMSEANALASENAAALSASAASADAGTASAAASTATGAALDASGYADAAAASESTASAAASAASASESSASASASSASADAQSASGDADAAALSASAAASSESAAGASATVAQGAQGAAEGAASDAEDSAVLSESYAIGGTGTRTGEDTDNAKYYMEQAAEIVGGDFATKTEAQGYANTAETNAKSYADTQDSGKADKKVPATPGNLASLDATGNLADSGKVAADFANAVHSHTKSNITDFPASMPPTAHKTSHATGGSDAISPADIGAATRTGGTATLAVASWTGIAAPYAYALAVTGMTASDRPHVDRVTGTDAAAAELINEAWGLITGNPVKPQTSAGYITFYATDKPTVAIPIMWELVRG